MWHYSRSAKFERAWWDGFSAPIGKPHFHEETQLVIVLSGVRCFELDKQVCEIAAGECLVIRAGQLHRSVEAGGAPTRCLNLYLPSSIVNAEGGLEAISASSSIMSAESGFGQSAVNQLSDASEARMSISALARASGYSREGYTRRFSKEMGIAPGAFSLLVRLNRARALLRAGLAPAEVAVECDFSDQSHLGRHFTRVFGIPPGLYSRSINSPLNPCSVTQLRRSPDRSIPRARDP